jgi:hypothetical protein
MNGIATSGVSPLSVVLPGVEIRFSSLPPAERMVGDASTEGVHRWVVRP